MAFLVLWGALCPQPQISFGPDPSAIFFYTGALRYNVKQKSIITEASTSDIKIRIGIIKSTEKQVAVLRLINAKTTEQISFAKIEKNVCISSFKN